MNYSESNVEESRAKEKSFGEFFLTVKNVIREQGLFVSLSCKSYCN